MKIRKKDRERLISLYIKEKETFSKEKVELIEKKIRLEEEEYLYDPYDEDLYEFLDKMAEEIYNLSVVIGLYHWVEENMRKDEVQKVRKSSESPSHIIHRWMMRDTYREDVYNDYETETA